MISNYFISNQKLQIPMIEKEISISEPITSLPVKMTPPLVKRLLHPASYLNQQIKGSLKALSRDWVCFITAVLLERILFLHRMEEWILCNWDEKPQDGSHHNSTIQQLLYCTQRDNLLWCFYFGWRCWSSCKNAVFLIFKLADHYWTKTSVSLEQHEASWLLLNEMMIQQTTLFKDARGPF